MKWTCTKCGLKLSVSDTTPRVFCQCGYVNEVFSRGDWRARNVPLTAFDRERPIGSPHWEQAERRSTCKGCEHFNNESARCPFIDLGCHRTYERVITSTQGRCPKGKWSVSVRKWITNSDLAALVTKVAEQLPADASRVIAVPRSGMMAAAYLAAHLHLPLYSIHEGQVIAVGGGNRMRGHVERSGRAIVVDDTVAGGNTWRRLASEGALPAGALRVAMYCAPQCAHVPDIVGEIMPLPHLLEWNLFSCGYMDMAGLDIDGLVCEDNWDNPDPKPLYLPRNRRAKALITARVESHRQSTRDWLDKWGVKYDTLVMWPGTKEERTLEAVADYKAAAVVATDCAFYVESNTAVANAMRERGIRVLCPEEGLLA